MKYENAKTCVPCEGTASPSAPTKPLSGMMDQANNMAEEILIMAYKINAHMFGMGKPDGENAASPQCFRDALNNQIMTLDKAAIELMSIMAALGVREA